MKKTLWIVAMLLGAAACAADTDPLVNFYGNTLTVTGTEGTTRLWYTADGAFTGIDHRGERIRGTWKATPTQLCTYVEGAKEHCGRNVGVHQVGEKWDDTRPDGSKVHLSLTAGNEGSAPASPP